MAGLASLEGWAGALAASLITSHALEGSVDVFPIETGGALGTAGAKASLATSVANEAVVSVFVPGGWGRADSAAFGGSRLEGKARTAC